MVRRRQYLMSEHDSRGPYFKPDNLPQPIPTKLLRRVREGMVISIEEQEEGEGREIEKGGHTIQIRSFWSGSLPQFVRYRRS